MLMADDYQEVINLLENGKVILYPTDTIWGIGCDVFNELAVEQVYKIKQRDRDKPLIILVSDLEMLKKYVPHIHPRIETLLIYHRRPLTIIYDAPINLPDWVINADNTIAIRLAQDSFAKNLIKYYKKPIISTSANMQGTPSPDDYISISKKIKNDVDFIVPEIMANKILKHASVIIKYDADGEIELIR